LKKELDIVQTQIRIGGAVGHSSAAYGGIQGVQGVGRGDLAAAVDVAIEKLAGLDADRRVENSQCVDRRNIAVVVEIAARGGRVENGQGGQYERDRGE
jgi:hypothetical protein